MVTPQQFRDLRASVPSPVTIVTTADENGPVGATVSAFMPLSINPHLILIAMEDSSRVLDRIRERGQFAVNILAEQQAELAMIFGGPGREKFAHAEWHLDHGLPRFDRVASWLSCEVADTLPGGDHVILLGKVTAVSNTETAPMVYSHRLFGTHSEFAHRPKRALEESIGAFRR